MRPSAATTGSVKISWVTGQQSSLGSGTFAQAGVEAAADEEEEEEEEDIFEFTKSFCNVPVQYCTRYCKTVKYRNIRMRKVGWFCTHKSKRTEKHTFPT